MENPGNNGTSLVNQNLVKATLQEVNDGSQGGRKLFKYFLDKQEIHRKATPLFFRRVTRYIYIYIYIYAMYRWRFTARDFTHTCFNKRCMFNGVAKYGIFLYFGLYYFVYMPCNQYSYCSTNIDRKIMGKHPWDNLV